MYQSACFVKLLGSLQASRSHWFIWQEYIFIKDSSITELSFHHVNMVFRMRHLLNALLLGKDRYQM